MSDHVRLSVELQATMRMAQAMAANLLHEYVLPEHLCLALLNDPEIADTVQECGGDVGELGEQLQEYLRDEVPARDGIGETEEEGESPRPTLAYRRIINFAALHVLSCEKGTVDNFDTLIALYRERNSHAVYFLLNQGVTRAKVIEFASLDRAGHGVDEESDGDTASDDGAARPARRPKRDPLAEFATNLTAAAADGKIDPIIGRGKELRRVMRTLCRRRKNNPLLVGESGVGKTAIAEGLALRISEDAVPPSLQGAQIFALDLGGMLAGTKFRGEFEDRLKGVLKAVTEHENAILFIDELHTAVGAGATQGGSMDAANLLKPALQSGDLRCMGSTTYKEYKSHILKDHALARRFQKIDVTEPSAEETVEILKGLRTRYEEHFGIGIPDAALEAAVSLTSRYVNDRFLPDKAIDAMDEAGAEQALLEPEARRALTEEDIEVVVADMAQIPPAKVSGTDEERLRDLQGALEKVVYGQSGAVRSVTHAIKLSRAGLREPHKPVGSFLFAGPTGVGKTELAKQLANCLGIEFLRFDMSEYSEKHTVSRLIGAPPGYVGFDQGGLLTDVITKTPHAVLLLDEVEKAHADIFNILLQVMDHGTLTDNNGRKADFQSVILIMTSNVGAKELDANRIGFADRDALPGDNNAAIERFFSPEFRNRLDAVVHFAPLTLELIEKVVDKFIRETESRLTDKGVRIKLTPAARKWLAETGYDPKFGARPIARLIERELQAKLVDALLFGDLKNGGTVSVSVAGGELVLETKPGKS